MFGSRSCSIVLSTSAHAVSAPMPHSVRLDEIAEKRKRKMTCEERKSAVWYMHRSMGEERKKACVLLLLRLSHADHLPNRPPIEHRKRLFGLRSPPKIT
ncbi:hypothetical protein P280DRAFT_143622 [Massarina eburnea CBS 473.64]|uniref:Uncharacterized protein n=1 Tax=Massarina eburnea CBS 473.64 TaxID=1395130 RepID=A0A6A6RRM2_9PLEO|nr:hypothetical protein P280DRAFT_143622 [Massarina eburnea CBS 473.64]